VRTIIALELDMSADVAGQFADLSTRLEQALADAVREHRAQAHVRPLQLLITLAEPVPSAASEAPGWPTEILALPPTIKPLADARGPAGFTAPCERLPHDMSSCVSTRRQSASLDLDRFEEFPSEQIDGPPHRIEPASIFTYVPAQVPPDLVRTEPLTRRQPGARPRGDDSFQALVRTNHASRCADAPGQRLRVARSILRRRDIIFACAVAVLVALQPGGWLPGSAKLRGGPLESPPNSTPYVGAIVRRPDSSWTPTPTEMPASRFDPPRAVTLPPAGNVVTSLQGHDPQRSRARQMAVSETTGFLLVESEPSGGQVFLNQAPIGVTPLALSNVRARAYAVKIDVKGYAPWSRGIYVIPQQTTRVTALLEPDR
jgi:hypothetical protein